MAIQPSVGTHLLKITGVSLANQLCIDRYFQSEVFTVGGYSWTLRYYPDGWLESDKGEYVGLTLALESDVTDYVDVGPEFSLLDADGREGNKKVILEKPETFKYKGRGWVYSEFIKKVDLFSSSYINNDSFTVKCTVSVTNPLLANGERVKDEVEVSMSEMVIGVHQYTISNFSMTPIGFKVLSSTFTVGGYQWAISCYPNGNNKDNAEFVSLYLQMQSENQQVQAKWYFRIVDEREWSEQMTTALCSSKFQYRGHEWGIGRFIKCSDLFSSSPPYLKNDCLKIKCIVGVISSSCSSSASASESVVGTHCLKVNGISLAKDLGSGMNFSSSVFDVGAYSWTIRYYPDGWGDDEKGEHIGVGLMLQSSVDAPVSASFQFSLMNPDDGEVDSYNQALREPARFEGKGARNGFPSFIKKAELRSSSYLKNDSMTFKCTISVLNPSPNMDDSLKRKDGVTKSEVVIGMHDYTISHYSKIGRHMNNKRYITSETFSVGGYNWAIKYYPGGLKEEDNAEFVSVFLLLQSNAPSVHAQFKFKIAVRGKYWSSPMDDLKFVEFQYDKHRDWGVRKFLRRSDLLSPSSQYLKGDCLKIKCILGVKKDPEAASHNQEASSSSSAPVVRERKRNPKKKLPL